jgi:hypothetical protein
VLAYQGHLNLALVIIIVCHRAGRRQAAGEKARTLRPGDRVRR